MNRHQRVIEPKLLEFKEVLDVCAGRRLSVVHGNSYGSLLINRSLRVGELRKPAAPVISTRFLSIVLLVYDLSAANADVVESHPAWRTGQTGFVRRKSPVLR